MRRQLVRHISRDHAHGCRGGVWWRPMASFSHGRGREWDNQTSRAASVAMVTAAAAAAAVGVNLTYLESKKEQENDVPHASHSHLIKDPRSEKRKQERYEVVKKAHDKYCPLEGVRDYQTLVKAVQGMLTDLRQHVGLPSGRNFGFPNVFVSPIRKSDNALALTLEMPVLDAPGILQQLQVTSDVASRKTLPEGMNRTIVAWLSAITGKLYADDAHKFRIIGTDPTGHEMDVEIDGKTNLITFRTNAPDNIHSKNHGFSKNLIKVIMDVYLESLNKSLEWQDELTPNHLDHLMTMFAPPPNDNDSNAAKFRDWIQENRDLVRREWIWWLGYFDYMEKSHYLFFGKVMLENITEHENVTQLKHEVALHSPTSIKTSHFQKVFDEKKERLEWMKWRFEHYLAQNWGSLIERQSLRGQKSSFRSAFDTDKPQERLKSSFVRAIPGMLNGSAMDQVLQEYGAIFRKLELPQSLKSRSGASNDVPKELRDIPCSVYTKESHAVDGVNWDNLAGYDYIRKIIMENILLPRQYPDIYKRVSNATRKKPSSVSKESGCYIFYGPPGTGKTTTARIIASQIDVPMVCLSFESIATSLYGEAQKKLDQILKKISSLPDGAVVFIDEAETFFPSRARDPHNSSYDKRLLSIFLKWVEGMEQNNKVVVILATNHDRALDDALKSRASLALHFGLPDEEARKKIWQQYAKHLSDRELAKLVEVSEGMTARDILKICDVAERTYSSELIQQEASKGHQDSGDDGDESGDKYRPPLDRYLRHMNDRLSTHGDSKSSSGFMGNRRKAMENDLFI